MCKVAFWVSGVFSGSGAFDGQNLLKSFNIILIGVTTFALLSMPPYLPDAFVFEIIFSSILAVSFILFAKYSFLRKHAFFLFPVGFLELMFSWGNAFTEGIIIGFVTLIGGMMLPMFNAIRLQLNKKSVKLSLILLGCVGILVGAISLYYSELKAVFYHSTILTIHAKGELLLLGIVLLTVGFYSSIIGIASLIVKANNRR
jgi:hypothetical protein